jgi:hypothetical protein
VRNQGVFDSLPDGDALARCQRPDVGHHIRANRYFQPGIAISHKLLAVTPDTEG